MLYCISVMLKVSVYSLYSNLQLVGSATKGMLALWFEKWSQAT